jgi:hypothetical protein
MSSSSTPTFAKLSAQNYPTWAGEMEAWLRSAGVWRIVDGSSVKPTEPSPNTKEHTEAVEAWEIKSDKAAGWLYLMVEHDQRIHFNGIQSDPVKMWKALKDVHLQQRPGNRFNAYDDLFSIRKQEEESLQTLMNRVDEAMRRITDLRSSDFDIKKLDEELTSMALIRALSDEYSGFVSSLLLLDKLDRATIHSAFVTEETQRRRRASDMPSVVTAMVASQPKGTLATVICEFCAKPRHTMQKCYAFQRAQKAAKQRTNNPNPKPFSGNQVNKAQETSSETAAAVTITEFAGNASAISYDPSDPTTPLGDADYDWLADTGATSHMTPHHHWIRNYIPLRVPIRLADNTIIYSAGVGTVVFMPIINGSELRSVEFSRVLHVPKLKNNLLSCLYLTKHKGYIIHITSTIMDFTLNGKTLFHAGIQSNNCATLSGVTQGSSEYANMSSTLPLDLSLWHRRCIHHNYADIHKMVREKMVTGLDIHSDQKPDPICEPCLAGKMHSDPFPSSPSHCAKPLELVHTDLHGPLPVQTPEGYHYWITFIDDCTRFRVVIMLKRKSDTFEAFMKFKAYAENTLNCKLKALQDDKEGIYMSNRFIKYTDECGIIRRHTTRNRPQQNGVAERANRILGEDITAMLSESNLPASFWGHCLNAMVHVWNRLPTAPMGNITPYEAWHNKKPDISHLRVWGCTAYVYIQRDKRKSLEPHMEKCIFVGYPEGYKGWRFYNPTTKKFIISERAEFDERYFPGLSQKAPMPPLDLNPIRSEVLNGENNVPWPNPGGDNRDYMPSPTPSTSIELSPTPEPPPMSSQFQAPTHSESHDEPSLNPGPEKLTISRPRGFKHAPLPGTELKRSPRLAGPNPGPNPIAGPDPISKEPAIVIDEDDVNAAFADILFAGLAKGVHPQTYKQAMKSDDAEKWRQAALEEYNTLMQNHTWELVPLPDGQKAIPSGWVFIIKRKEDGTPERYKARIVAKGYSQRPGIDYHELFAPTFRAATLRLIIALAGVQDLELHSVDISAAFTNGDLDEEIYMVQPEGFHQGNENIVCRLM